MPEHKDGNEVMAEAAAQPTMDEVMRRDPKDVDERALRVIVEHQREQRALFIKSEEKKKARREGVEDDG